MASDLQIPSDEDILEIANSGDLEKTLDWFRKWGEQSPYFFSKVIAGYQELTPDLHQPVCQWLVDSEVLRGRGLLFPRKYFKSSMTKGYVLRAITLNAEERILFVGENDDVGKKNLRDIRWKIQSDPFFQALYPKLIPQDYGKSWSETSITIPRSRSYDEPTIQSIGIGAKYTGFHHTKIIYDDPIGLVASKSKAEMQTAIEWFQAAPGLLDSVDAQELYNGTRWKHGEADLPGWIMANLPYKKFSDGHQEGYQWLIRGAIENGQSIFPPQVSSATGKRIGYSLQDLMSMKKRQKTYLFNANMMNDPTAGEDTDFQDTWIRSFTWAEDRKFLILEDGERVSVAHLVKISIYDPSSGGASAEAENAIVVIGCDARGRIFVLFDWSKNCSFGRAIEAWHRINDRWHCWRNWYEAVGAHKEVGEKIRDRKNPCQYVDHGKVCGKTHQQLRAQKIIPPPGPKEDRIRELAQPAFEERIVYLHAGMTKLRKQITEFPHGSLVDLFDALAYAISKARRGRVEASDDGDDPPVPAKPPQSTPRTHTTVDYGGY